MDFANLKMVDTNILELKNPATDDVISDGNGNVASLEIYGGHTDIFSKAQNKLEKMIENIKKTKKEPGKDVYLNFYISITKDIHNIKEDGEDIKDIKYFYENFQWATGQVNDFLAESGNFLRNPYGV